MSHLPVREGESWVYVFQRYTGYLSVFFIVLFIWYGRVRKVRIFFLLLFWNKNRFSKQFLPEILLYFYKSKYIKSETSARESKEVSVTSMITW